MTMTMNDENAHMPEAAHIAKTPGHWRKRSEEMRALVEGANDHEAKAIMVRIADEFDRLAKRTEERAASVARVEERVARPKWEAPSESADDRPSG